MLFPAVLLLVFGLVQGALWYHARDVATAAAAEGAAAGRAEAGTAAAGEQQAAAFLARTGDSVLDARVVATRDAARVQVTVSGRSISLLPGLPGPAVNQSVTGPVERFTSRTAP